MKTVLFALALTMLSFSGISQAAPQFNQKAYCDELSKNIKDYEAELQNEITSGDSDAQSEKEGKQILETMRAIYKANCPN